MWTYLAITLIALVTSFALTPVAKRLGPRLGAMDIPNRLSIHSSPTPRDGGLAIFTGFLLSIGYGVLTVHSLSPDEKLRLLGILASGGLMALVGFLGDRGTIPTKVEFSLLLIPAVLVILFGIRVRFMPIVYLSIPLTFFYIIGGSCAMNLLDGMDGLATSVAVIASFFFATLSLSHGNELEGVLSVALLGSALGFLPHNFHRARIFMGDVGSLFLGFILATLAVLFSSEPYDFVSFAVPILILGVPVGDTFAAVVRRAINRRGVLSGDRRHLYDLLRAKGLGDRATVLILCGISAISGTMALIISRMDNLPALTFFTTAFFLFCLAAIWLEASTAT